MIRSWPRASWRSSERGVAAELMADSKSSVISWEALPAYSGLNLKPFQMPGLWLAVMMAAPAACRWRTLKLSTGVGAGSRER